MDEGRTNLQTYLKKNKQKNPTKVQTMSLVTQRYDTIIKLRRKAGKKTINLRLKTYTDTFWKHPALLFIDV